MTRAHPTVHSDSTKLTDFGDGRTRLRAAESSTCQTIRARLESVEICSRGRGESLTWLVVEAQAFAFHLDDPVGVENPVCPAQAAIDRAGKGPLPECPWHWAK